MANTILVCGYGPGISTAVASLFGARGFSVALVARNAERLEAGVKALQAKGVKAAAFPTDLSDPKAAAGVVAKAHEKLGPVGVVHWNAYGGSDAGDLLTADDAATRGIFDVAITSLLATVRAALPDLRQAAAPGVLVTNGGLAKPLPQVDAMGVAWNAMGLSVANAAKDKLVGLLSSKLKADKIYVGQVMVNGLVKGTAFDSGNATIRADDIAALFWKLYEARTEIRAEIG